MQLAANIPGKISATGNTNMIAKMDLGVKDILWCMVSADNITFK